ncbi:MAG: glycosyltransferase, partial [Fimbriimonadales bacterium]
MEQSVSGSGFALYVECHPDQTALPEAFYQLAGGQFEQAYQQFHAWLETHPHDEWAYEGAIASLLQQNRWDEAQTLTLKGLEQMPGSHVLRARATWLLVYQIREREAYPLVKTLLEEGYQNRLWLEEVVLPLRNHLVCLSGDKRFPTPKNLSRKAFRRQLNEQIQLLEHWLARHRVALPEEPVGTRISLTMIVRNEAEFLAECLQSVEGVVDEIVIVDTGSTDDTVAIAERFGARVIHSPWQNDFAQARNVALQHATGDWVLVLDADERLTPESRAKILDAVRHPQFVGYYMDILNYTSDDKYAGMFQHRLVRLFRRLSWACWEGAIHEQILNSLQARGGRPATLHGAQILHYGYHKQVVQERRKAQRNVALLEKALEENSDDPFHWFNLGNTYYVEGDHEQAVPYLKEACERLGGHEDFAPFCWSLYIESL